MYNKFGLSDSLVDAVKSIVINNRPVAKNAAFGLIEEADIDEAVNANRLRDELKSKGNHEEAGAVAFKHGLGRSYGPHFGMRSSKPAAETAFLKGYDKAAAAAKKAAKKTNEAMDPVGREDKDVDNDGDSDKSDSYLLKRRKAIRAAMSKGKKDKINTSPKELNNKGDM